jgi:hypothetical protein
MPEAAERATARMPETDRSKQQQGCQQQERHERASNTRDETSGTPAKLGTASTEGAPLKVVGNQKVGWVWNMSNCPNLARTAAIEVRFSLNFAVFFDFTYFRFRPSKAKWIGIV